MCESSITGKPNRITILETKKCLDWYLGLLLPDLNTLVHVDVVFRPYLKRTYGTEAQVRSTDHCESPRDFTLVLDNCMSRIKTLKSIAHECVHIKQLAINELSCGSEDGDNIWWFGKAVDPDLDYWFTPHEIEAMGMEVGLYKKYMEMIRREKINLKRV